MQARGDPDGAVATDEQQLSPNPDGLPTRIGARRLEQ
jgi:hypothetical protein